VSVYDFETKLLQIRKAAGDLDRVWQMKSRKRGIHPRSQARIEAECRRCAEEVADLLPTAEQVEAYLTRLQLAGRMK
jgi:hypothetical protein